MSTFTNEALSTTANTYRGQVLVEKHLANIHPTSQYTATEPFTSMQYAKSVHSFVCKNIIIIHLEHLASEATIL